MCGIVGVVSDKPVAGILVEGLRRLEYRGYDSAGIATLDRGGIERRRAEGKLSNLEALMKREPVGGVIGIGHTRWATHGRPNRTNAHPHATEHVAVVHNGIIENHRDLRRELEAQGYGFETETDSEVISRLINRLLDQGLSPEVAASQCLEHLEGAFAFAAIFSGDPALIFAARRGAPLVLGHGDGEMYVASDTLALAPITRRITYLEEGDRAFLRPDGFSIHDESGNKTEREINHVTVIGGSDKGDFAHYMLKEIHEQPAAVGDTLTSFINPITRTITLPEMDVDWSQVPKVNLVACGTSYYATLVARYWFEQWSDMPTQCDLASEFRYRDPFLSKGGVTIFVSQSGETADTLAALRHARAAGQYCMALVNVPESAMAREADCVLPTHGGPEVSVASTKAFTTQLALLAVLAVAVGRARQRIDSAQEAVLAQALTQAPAWIAETLRQDGILSDIAQSLAAAQHVLYLGRGTSYPLALEGALKLKEISYIHAEGYAAGEMKHGPIALIEKDVPVVMIAPSDALFAKTLSNMEEVAARGARIIAVTDAQGAAAMDNGAVETVIVPRADPLVAPLVYAVAVQLLAYRTAIAKGTDVDQPRNLAKSVTVE